MLTVEKLQGSLLRCLLLMWSLPRKKTAMLLTNLARPSGAVISEHDFWMPKSLLEWKETTLKDESEFLDDERRKNLINWWLAVPKGANLPNWDIASTCTIEGKRGLLLIEAKAHSQELVLSCVNQRNYFHSGPSYKKLHIN